MHDGTLRVNIPSNVSFDTGKYDLKPALLPVLNSVARALVQHLELRAKSIGYTDSTGSAATNQTLSVNRARADDTYLTERGVHVGYMKEEERGTSNSIGKNATDEGREIGRGTGREKGGEEGEKRGDG